MGSEKRDEKRGRETLLGTILHVRGVTRGRLSLIHPPPPPQPRAPPPPFRPPDEESHQLLAVSKAWRAEIRRSVSHGRLAEILHSKVSALYLPIFGHLLRYGQ
jgi:hypothetical protein